MATDVFSTPVPARANVPSTRPETRPEIAEPRRLDGSILTRRYEIAWLTEDGGVATDSRVAPAIAEFEEAFSALARGTVVATTEGPVAVEDLVPGMEVLTAEGRAEPITWIGSMTLFPSGGHLKMETATLTRITADAFGIGRPMPDLLLGPHARILLRDPRCRAFTGASACYAPARSFIEGISVIELRPVAPVTVHNLVLRRHGSLKSAGLEIESYHPGSAVGDLMDPQLAEIFLSLFPQMRSLADFGPLSRPRMAARDVELALGR